MLAETNEVFKMSTLAEYTGLTDAQLRRTHKMLQDSNIYKIDIVYEEGTFYRKGEVAILKRIALQMTTEEKERLNAARNKHIKDFESKQFSAKF